MKRLLAIVLVLSVVALTAPVAGERPRIVKRGHVRLCVLQAKPENAFTFVPPAPLPMRPMAFGGGATITVTYVGFNLFPGAQAAFEYAVNVYRNLLTSPVPIRVLAEFKALEPGTLGSAGAFLSHLDVPGGMPGTFYGDPLADRLSGQDQLPGEYDITAEFSLNAAWYFGTDGATPPGQYDFVSVVLHELTHGLGFAGSAQVVGNAGFLGYGGIPDIFDHFAVTEDGDPLLGFTDGSAALASQLTQPYNPMDPTGPGVYWGGVNGMVANAGTRPRLYTPATWIDGSSYSHLDEHVFPAGNQNSLMTFALAAAEAIHDPGPIVLGMFEDMGWEGPAPDVVVNGTFTNGSTGWDVFPQNPADIVADVVGGVMEFHRPTGSTVGVVLNQTHHAYGAGQQILASFELGNSSNVRKRVSVLIHDFDFSDLTVCTFWLWPTGGALLPYQMLTHTRENWTNATVAFYAATVGADGGSYRLDNVSLRAMPSAAANQTLCYDPWYPPAPGDPNGPELLGNGNFGTGLLPPWETFGTITSQIAGGVFEFIRPGPGVAGVVFQQTFQAVPADGIVSSFFQLGNSSSVPKRVTVILGDRDFSDLSACTFWLDPGTPLRTYGMRAYATKAWVNATLSVFAATIGPEQWTRLDNATMFVSPDVQIFGTQCGEPGSAIVASRPGGG